MVEPLHLGSDEFRLVTDIDPMLLEGVVDYPNHPKRLETLLEIFWAVIVKFPLVVHEVLRAVSNHL